MHRQYRGDLAMSSDGDVRSTPAAIGRELVTAPGQGFGTGVGWVGGRALGISVALIDENALRRECLAKSLELREGIEVVPFGRCEDCLDMTGGYDLILLHLHDAPMPSDDHPSLPPLERLKGIAPVIILAASERPDTILTLLENGARGYIPTSITSIELTIEIIRLVRAGGTFVPAGLLPHRHEQYEAGTRRAPGTGPFTPRQMAVLKHLRLGKANKIIAYELDMSESTVKVHVRNIMKKMKATNRTEVACRAHAFIANGSSTTRPAG